MQGGSGHPGTCATCGSSDTVAEEHQQEEAREDAEQEADVRSYQGFRNIGLGCCWFVGGVVVTLSTCGMASALGGGVYVVATGAIIGGVVQIVVGVLQLMRKGPPPS
jgi:hypothetical protein